MTAATTIPRTVFGEPRAVAYLAFTEAWERFSYYGMISILVLYMSQALLLPGRIEHVVGFATFRAVLEAVFGRMSTVALTSQIYGLYSALVYFTPVFGGLIADRWLGRRNAVVLGAVLMSLGHLAMAFDASFLLALLLLIVGCGLLKGNISTQVGSVYAEDDAAGRTRGYAIFSTGINVGAVAGPIVCGYLADRFGWHAGFGFASILMLIGLATYLAGYRELSEAQHSAPAAVTAKVPLTRAQLRTIAALIAVMGITIFHSIAYSQNGNMAIYWVNAKVDLDILGFHVPPEWFNSIDSLVSIVVVPFLFMLWRWQARHGGEPDEIAKIGAGALMSSIANLILVAGSAAYSRVPVLIPVAYDFVLGVAFLYYWPTLLALVSRAAPPQIKATMMGIALLTLFLANFAVGWIGSFYERLTQPQFWAIHAAIGAMGSVLAFTLRRPLMRILDAADV